MIKVFLDTNIVLDFILRREVGAEDAAIIFDLGERKKIKLTLSSLSVNNIDYIVSKIDSKKKSRQIIIKLLSLVEVLPVDKTTVKQAAMSAFKDFEDAIQNYCAEGSGISTIVTRNLKDYKKSNLSVLTPKEFLTSLTINKK